MHYLFFHIDRFPENFGSMSDKQGERFYHDVKGIEIRYQRCWDAAMMADWCWTLKSDIPLLFTREYEKTKVYFLKFA